MRKSMHTNMSMSNEKAQHPNQPSAHIWSKEGEFMSMEDYEFFRHPSLQWFPKYLSITQHLAQSYFQDVGFQTSSI